MEHADAGPSDAEAWCRAHGFAGHREFWNATQEHIEDLLRDAGLPRMLVHTAEEEDIAVRTGIEWFPAVSFKFPDGSHLVVNVPGRHWEAADADCIGPSGQWVDAGTIWEDD